MKKELIGQLVHGWPNKEFFGIIVDYSEGHYIVYWFNWNDGDIYPWYHVGGDEASIEANLIKPS